MFFMTFLLFAIFTFIAQGVNHDNHSNRRNLKDKTGCTTLDCILRKSRRGEAIKWDDLLPSSNPRNLKQRERPHDLHSKIEHAVQSIHSSTKWTKEIAIKVWWLWWQIPTAFSSPLFKSCQERDGGWFRHRNLFF